MIISFKARVLIGFSLILSLMAGLSSFCLKDYAKLTSVIHDIDSQYLPDALLAAQMGHDVVQVQQFLTDVSATHNPAGYEDAEEAAQSFKKGLETLRAQAKSDAATLEELTKIEAAFTVYYATGKRMAEAYIKQGIDAGNVIMEDFDQASLAINERTNKLRDHKKATAAQSVHDLSMAAEASAKLMHDATIAGIGFGLAIALYLVYYLSKQLGIDPYYAKLIAQEVAKGNLKRTITVNSRDKSSLLYHLKVMQESINAFIAAQRDMAQQHALGFSAQIDAANFPGSYGKMAQETNDLVNAHIAEKTRIVEVIAAYAQGDFSVDMDRLPGDKANITAAVDDVKQTLLTVSNEIKLLAEAGKQGDFSKRADTSRFEFMFKDILTNINALLATCDTGFGDVSRVTQALAKGDLSQRITRDYPGTFGEVKASIVVMQNALQAFIASQAEMAKQHAAGMTSFKMQEQQFPGTFGTMAHDINELVNAHIAEKSRIIEVIAEYAKGNFNEDMDRLPGDKATITRAVDNVKTTLLAVSSEIKQLVEAGAQGDFSPRSNAEHFDFMFKDILTDLNMLFSICDTSFGDIAHVTQALAHGNLTQTITNHYPGTFGKVTASVNQTISNLQDLIAEIKHATDSIFAGSKEIASGNDDLAHRAETQAANIEQTASSMEELTSTVKNNANNAQQANQVATTTQNLAENGGLVVANAIKAMQEINNSSAKIADIINVIDEITFQTNLLALNASVEASRAAEHGRGFAVVAKEVRNLAQRSAAAARESRELIQSSMQKIQVGAAYVNETGNSLSTIVNSVKQVSGIMGEIASASIEQSAGIDLVNRSITQLDEITQQNAALAEQAAAASKSMRDQAIRMNKLLSTFTLASPSAVPNRVNALPRTLAA